MPYRSGKRKRKVEAASDGVVADLVRQFADPFAFVRELVQNAIDSGATRIDVIAEHDGTARLSVVDDGAGMSRSIVEGPLLTVFSSAKEGSGAIGKYGVGFVSVFAIEPDEVWVDTRTANEAWRLKVRPDHSYELSEAERRAGTGTRVTLAKVMTRAEFEQLAAQCHIAVRRWCRHCLVPLYWTYDMVPVRIDGPIAIEAPTYVEQHDADAHYVVAPQGDGGDEDEGETQETFAGFYNRGLTLFETDRAPVDELRGIRFKVMCSALQHTLSRDNVRHDAAYEYVVDRVVELARGPLVASLIRELDATAEALTKADDESARARYLSLLQAARGPALWLDDASVTLPLAAPIGTRRTCTLAELEEVVHAPAMDTFSATLGQHGVRVVLAVDERVIDFLRLRERTPRMVRRRYMVLRVVTGGRYAESDAQLLGALRSGLRAVGRKVDDVVFVDKDGGPSDSGAAVEASDKTEYVMSVDGLGTWWRLRGTIPRLLLFTNRAAVSSARRTARHDPLLAAQLLVRVLALEGAGCLSARQNDALLDAIRGEA